MKLGPYAVTFEAPYSVALNAVDAWRVILFGIPRAPGNTPAEIARGVLRRNAGPVLYAGEGHFRFMWVSDFAKSLRGAWGVLGEDYLGGQIDAMTRSRRGSGTSRAASPAITASTCPGRAATACPGWSSRTPSAFARTGRRPGAELQRLFDAYEATHFENGLISTKITGDWADTVRRPSSTYNNLCALMALREAPALGLRPKTNADDFSRRLLEDRWRGDHFRDHAADGSAQRRFGGAGAVSRLLRPRYS